MARSVAPVTAYKCSFERQLRRRKPHLAICVAGLGLASAISHARADVQLRPSLQIQTDPSPKTRVPPTHELRIPTVRDAGGQQVVPQAVIRRLAPNARWTTEAFPAPKALQPALKPPVVKPMVEPVKPLPLAKPTTAAIKPPRPAELVETPKPTPIAVSPRKPLHKDVQRAVVPTSHTPATQPTPVTVDRTSPIVKPAEPQPLLPATTAEEPASVNVVRLQPLAKQPAPSILAEPEVQAPPKPRLVAAFSPVFVPVKTDALMGKEPAPSEAQCLPASLKKVLAEASRRFGTIWVTSAHRSVERNRLVGGRPRSFHLECRAVDFRPERNPLGLMAFLRGRPEVGGLKRYPNGLFHIDDGPRRTW